MTQKPKTKLKLPPKPGPPQKQHRIFFYNLIVNHLPKTWMERSMKKMFSPFGEIKSCRLMRHLSKGAILRKGYGFVAYYDYEDALDAIRHLNGKHVEGKKIKVSFAQPKQIWNDHELSVEHMPKTWSDKNLSQFFERVGRVKRTTIFTNERNQADRTGLVVFHDEGDMLLALMQLNGVQPTPSDRALNVRLTANGYCTTQRPKEKVSDYYSPIKNLRRSRPRSHPRSPPSS